MERVFVDFDGGGHGVDADRRIVTVTGVGEESFYACLERAVGTYDGKFQLVVYDLHGVLVYWFVVDRDLTMSEIAAFAGSDILAIDVLGRGGGEIWMLASVVRAGLAFAQLVTKAASSIADRTYADQRLAARNWMDLGGGVPSMSLRTHVNTEREWLRSDFDLVFGLDAEPGGRLLRACGYRKVSSAPDTWVDEKE
jgi:hypothetical protein